MTADARAAATDARIAAAATKGLARLALAALKSAAKTAAPAGGAK